MFNHSRDQNVGFQRDLEHQTIMFSTLRDIAPHEELCISYGPKLWFEDAEAAETSDERDEDPNVLAKIELP